MTEGVRYAEITGERACVYGVYAEENAWDGEGEKMEWRVEWRIGVGGGKNKMLKFAGWVTMCAALVYEMVREKCLLQAFL